MKRVSFAVLAVITLLALTAPVVMADDAPPPTDPGGGGCSGPNCR